MSETSSRLLIDSTAVLKQSSHLLQRSCAVQVADASWLLKVQNLKAVVYWPLSKKSDPATAPLGLVG